jgi:hypothetical protein
MRRARVRLAVRQEGAVFRPGDRRLAWGLAGAYAVLAFTGGALDWFLGDAQPLAHPAPWLELPAVGASALSVALGVAFAFVVVLGTRVSVARYAWAKRLHVELQPVARRLGAGETVVVAALSSLGEELFFRGLLTPLVGIVASSILFGLLHQVRGRSRWVWAAWASAVGLVLAVVFVATGSLLGPIVAHALINATNLNFLKTYEVDDAAEAG